MKWICTEHSCTCSASVFSDTFFFCMKVKLNQILLVAYLVLLKTPNSKIKEMSGLNKNTVTDLAFLIKKVMALNVQNTNVKIGGPGIVVEIDESKFGKLKDHYGHPVDGVWVFGGVERTLERRIFLYTVQQRDRPTLENIIENNIEKGSIIMSDSWRAYSHIHEMGYEHLTVNHEVEYKNKETGACTNTIEGSWRAIKDDIPTQKYNSDDIQDELFVFIWRRQNKNNLWNALINAICSYRISNYTKNE